MDRKSQTLLLLTALLASHMLSASVTCPSNKCQCRQEQVGGRLEMVVVCSSDQHKGYIPIFREYERPIASLSLDGIQLTRIRNNTFRSLRSIRELYLNDNYLVRIDGRAFANVDEDLELLDLQHNRLTDISFLKTHALPRLRELLLRDNRLATISVDTLSYLPTLENLNLDENRIGDSLSFLRQPMLRGLTDLNLDANGITAIDPQDFVYLKNIRSLLVNRNQLSDLSFLADGVFKQLQGMSAASNAITRADTALFSDKLAMKWIDLSSNRLQEANFTRSCSLSHLEEIYLSDNHLTALPPDAFKATSSLSIFVVRNNRLSTLPRCALARFYDRMDMFDISNNPLACDCRLQWLKSSHTIATYRHSQCIDSEFTDTDSFTADACVTGEPPCPVSSECSALGYVFSYSGSTDDLASEYQPSTAVSATISTSPKNLLSLFSLVLHMACST